MIGISRLDDLTESVTRFFEKLSEPNWVPRIVGVVFCQPHSIITAQEIRPSLNYFNFRSGDHVNFYFAGYELSNLASERWIHIPQYFNACRKQLETCSKWRYSGGTDLILLNANYDAKAKCAVIDFSSAECVVFEKLKQEGELLTVGMFFERIFQYCEDCFGRYQPDGVRTVPPGGSARHLQETLLKHRPSGNQATSAEINCSTDRLQTVVEAAVKSLTMVNSSTLGTITKAEAVADQLKKVMSPYRDMYRNPRLVDAKSEAMRAGIPELVVDIMVGQMHVSKFPTTDWLMKHLHASGEIKRLGAVGSGTSRASIGRMCTSFRRILVSHGLVDEYRSRFGASLNIPPISPGNRPDTEGASSQHDSPIPDTCGQELTEGENETE